ncbi:unnamed protein product, partial [Musa hybrid cultivar]
AFSLALPQIPIPLHPSLPPSIPIGLLISCCVVLRDLVRDRERMDALRDSWLTRGYCDNLYGVLCSYIIHFRLFKWWTLCTELVWFVTN